MSWLLPLSFLLPGLCMMDRHPFYHAAAATRNTVEGWFIKANQILLLSAALSFLSLSVFFAFGAVKPSTTIYCMLCEPYVTKKERKKERSRRCKELRWDTPCYKWTSLSVFSAAALINFSMIRKEVAVFVFSSWKTKRKKEKRTSRRRSWGPIQDDSAVRVSSRTHYRYYAMDRW